MFFGEGALEPSTTFSQIGKICTIRYPSNYRSIFYTNMKISNRTHDIDDGDGRLRSIAGRSVYTGRSRLSALAARQIYILDTLDIMRRAEWYAAYLDTSYWKALKQRVFEACDWKCEVCDRRYDPDLRKYSVKRTGLHGPVCHHLTYERIGCELLSDLSMPCKTCHVEIHNTNGPVPAIEVIYNPLPPPAAIRVLNRPYKAEVWLKQP